jgi:hypothetical protein
MNWEGAGEAEAAEGRRMKCRSLRAFLVTFTSPPPFNCAPLCKASTNLEIPLSHVFHRAIFCLSSQSIAMKPINTNRFLFLVCLLFLLISTVSSIPSESLCRLPGRRCVKDDDCCPIPFVGKVCPMPQLQSFLPFGRPNL